MSGLTNFITDHDIAIGLAGLVIVLMAVFAGFHRSANKVQRRDR